MPKASTGEQGTGQAPLKQEVLCRAAVSPVDDAVGEVVAKLKSRGLASPYLKAFVVARINPTRFSKASLFDFDEVLGKMIASAKRFNVDKIKQEDVARAGGPPLAEE